MQLYKRIGLILTKKKHTASISYTLSLGVKQEPITDLIAADNDKMHHTHGSVIYTRYSDRTYPNVDIKTRL